MNDKSRRCMTWRRFTTGSSTFCFSFVSDIIVKKNREALNVFYSDYRFKI